MSQTHPSTRRGRGADGASPWRWRRRFFLLLALLILIPGIALIYLANRFLQDRPVTYEGIEEHFKYGSTGGERESGFPYWIFQAMPQVCAQHLPGPGYGSLGFIYEPDKDLPIGMRKRRHQGIDRVFLNCAVCHTSTVRTALRLRARSCTGDARAPLRSAWRFEKFVFDCVARSKNSAANIVIADDRSHQRRGSSLLDRYLVYPVAIALMRERMLMLHGRFGFVFQQPDWGPGRVDTFNSAKVPVQLADGQLPEQELIGASDFPSIWNQRREGHAVALGRQQHPGRGAQQERSVRHRHDAADDRPRKRSGASSSGCSI